MDYSPAKKQGQRKTFLLGEISVFLTILSIGLVLAGTLVGTNATISRQVRTLFSSATEDPKSCSFKTIFGVYEEMPDKSLRAVTQQDTDLTSWGVSNDKQLLKNSASPFQAFEDSAEGVFETVDLRLKPEVGADYADKDKAAVTLFAKGLEEKYNLVRVFCNSNNGGVGCPSRISSQKPDMTIEDFEITCGVDIKYGWVISPKESSSATTPTPSSTASVTPSPKEPSPSTSISLTPPPSSITNDKDTYSLFAWSAEHGGDDMCFINADTKLGEHRSQGAHCNVTSCKNEDNEPTTLIVDFANRTNPTEDTLNLSAQINHCPGKILGELAGDGKNECNSFVSRKDNFPVGHGKKVRCIWKNPSDKASIGLNFTCQEVRESDPKNLKDVCDGTDSDEPDTQVPEGYRLDPFPYNKIINIEIPKQDGAYAISAILHKDGAVVTDQNDYSYSWRIPDSTIADIKPFNGCTNGIEEPCPYDHLSVTAKKAGSTTITVSVKRKDTRLEIATLDYTLYVNSPSAPTSAVSLAPTKAEAPAPTRSGSPRTSPTKSPTRRPEPTKGPAAGGAVTIKKEQVAFHWNSQFEKIGLAQDKITGFKFGICDTDVQAAHMKTRANGGAKCKWFPTDATSKEIILNSQKPSKGTIKPLADISVDFDGNPLRLDSGKDYYATCQYFEVNDWGLALDQEWRRCKLGKLDLEAIKRGEPLTFQELLDPKQYFLVPFNVALSDGGIPPVIPMKGTPYLGIKFLFKQSYKLTVDDTAAAFKVGLCPTEKLTNDCRYFSAMESFSYKNTEKTIPFLTSVDPSSKPLKAGDIVFVTCQFLQLDSESPSPARDSTVAKCRPRAVKVSDSYTQGDEKWQEPWGGLPSQKSSKDVIVIRNQGTASIPLFTSSEDTSRRPDTEDFQYTICDPDTGVCDVIEQNAFTGNENSIYNTSSDITSLSGQEIVAGKDYEITCQYRSEKGALVPCGTRTAIGGSPVFFDTFISPDSTVSFNSQNAIDRCDRNGDGACTIIDVAQCQAVAYGKQTQACDMNNDRYVDAADISLLFDYAGATN